MTTKYLDENGLRHLLSEIRSDVTPIKDGTAAVGTSKKLAKADHVHPKVTPSDIGAVSDVKIGDTSIVSSSVATIPKAGSSAYGVVKLSYSSSPVAMVKIQGVGSEFEVPELDSDGLIDPDELPEATTSKKGALSATDKTKLDGIAEGAEVNVQSDWNQTTTTADDYIKNKPTSMTPTSHSHGYISNDGKITNVGAITGNVWRFIMADAGGNLYRAGTPFDDSSDKAKYVLKQSGVFEALEATDIWYDTNVTVDDAIGSKAPLASPALTGTPTAPTATAGTNTTQIATTAFVKAAVDAAATGAVAYQGTVPISGQTGGFAPTNTTAGWYWIVQTAGTYAGEVCEAGDMIFCSTSASAYSASNFDVIQTNLDIATMTNAEIEAAISA